MLAQNTNISILIENLSETSCLCSSQAEKATFDSTDLRVTDPDGKMHIHWNLLWHPSVDLDKSFPCGSHTNGCDHG